MLADAGTAPRVRSTLERVAVIRRFARDRVGLRQADQSYTRFYDTGGEPVSWNVSASPPDRFEAYRWWFPVVGRLPYKGFFAAGRAQGERDRLRVRGYDAVVQAVSAYSTLGYFSDPILSTWAEMPEDRLADLVLHELTHAAVYVEDDTDYNESAATFVGRAGSLAFLAEVHGPDSEPVRQARQRHAEEERFTAFLRQVVAELDSLYRQGLPREVVLRSRQEVFAAAKEGYRARRLDLGGGRFDGFLEWEVNNARLLSYRRYHTGLDRFESVLRRREGDLAAAVGAIRDCGGSADPWACLQEEGGP